MNIAIYCGTSFGDNPIYKEKAINLIDYLSKKDVSIVYGGSKSGLMGLISNEAMSLNMKVYGVITYTLATQEIENTNITKLEKVATIRERKERMEELADAFIALPGGFGTLEEVSEIFTAIQVGTTNKPCALFNINGYFDKLIDYLKFCKDEGFLLQEHLDSLIVSDDINYIYKKLKNHQAPKSKWEILSAS
ncbi:LOG family protein [Halarcobacter anaerophilus]|jgi:hypothetical protein|uniref:Cytokinin riboside 5'-monophosphate phosphoribohydrolase n=1 Tax=Halarcobacter anaerophilus TaxID=877500 RepID=A0A4V1LQ34_9BACT|nr:TIGR00730 family Rossman fold protein [Halarcobacter anaerophilus]QDF28583.1 putative Rossmann fold nucleotide-binding protein [Halarcobacter anaerophilus]RXJ63308.1 TIGR00730 family Rossman fold protein [Halarcobacter anaerophilus]